MSEKITKLKQNMFNKKSILERIKLEYRKNQEAINEFTNKTNANYNQFHVMQKAIYKDYEDEDNLILQSLSKQLELDAPKIIIPESLNFINNTVQYKNLASDKYYLVTFDENLDLVNDSANDVIITEEDETLPPGI